MNFFKIFIIRYFLPHNYFLKLTQEHRCLSIFYFIRTFVHIYDYMKVSITIIKYLSFDNFPYHQLKISKIDHLNKFDLLTNIKDYHSINYPLQMAYQINQQCFHQV